MGFGKINVQELQGWFFFGLGPGLGVAASKEYGDQNQFLSSLNKYI